MDTRTCINVQSIYIYIKYHEHEEFNEKFVPS